MHTLSPVFRAETPEDGSVQLTAAEGRQEQCENDGTDSSFINITTRPLHDKEEREGMRAHEIIDGYVDPEAITAETRREVANALARQGPGLSPDEMAAMYGDPAEDMRLEQQRLDLEKTRAEIDRIEAAAARDRAKARRGR